MIYYADLKYHRIGVFPLALSRALGVISENKCL
jgi:hypothetical protein